MIATYKQFPLVLLRDCVDDYMRFRMPILSYVNTNDNIEISSIENEYRKDYRVHLYTNEYEKYTLFNPIQYILKVELDNNNRLKYEISNQDELKSKGYSTLSPEMFPKYKNECVRLVEEINLLLDRVGDDNFPESWNEYASLHEKLI